MANAKRFERRGRQLWRCGGERVLAKAWCTAAIVA